MKNILALDVGTTTVKAIIFDSKMNLVAKASRDLLKSHPKAGWVEQDPLEMLEKSRAVIKEVFTVSAVDPSTCVMGITNQRETTIIWHQKTGQPSYPAIVWEDSRTQEWCENQKSEIKAEILAKTGLSLISYFSVSKIDWILNEIDQSSDLMFGTVDSWLMWNLCTGNPHLTDKTNASRTLLFNIYEQTWDKNLIAEFQIPKSILPKIKNPISDFGKLDKSVVGFEIPITAVCGDQQASMSAGLDVSQSATACTKVTFGTGTFIMQIAKADIKAKDPFFKVITPNLESGVNYALEAKIDRGAKQVDQILKDSKKLDDFLKQLALDVSDLIKQLPLTPTEIIIDGGVSRDGIVAKYLEEFSGIKTKTLPIFDGTALGIAILASKNQV